MTLHVAGPVEVDLLADEAAVVVTVLMVQRCLRCDALLTTVDDGEDGLPVGEPVETAGGCEYAEPGCL